MRFAPRTTALFLVTASILLLRCGGRDPVSGTQQIEYPQAELQGTILVRVVNARTNAPLGNTTVDILGHRTSATDDSGMVKFFNLSVGSYLVLISRPGYEPVEEEFSLELDPNSTELPIVKSLSTTFELCSLGVTVRGKVFYEEQSIRKPAAGAQIALLIPTAYGSFSRPTKTINTTPDGSFMFTDLPEGIQFSFRASPFVVAGEIYGSTATPTVRSGVVGDTVTISPVVLTRTGRAEIIALEDNLADLGASEAIRIVFSEPIDTTKLAPDSIIVTASGGQKILTTARWTGGGTTLLVSPFGGTWSADLLYQLTIRQLNGTSGGLFSDTRYRQRAFSVAVSGPLGNVQNVRYRVGLSDTAKVDYGTASVTILWSKLANAQTYEVYTKRGAGLWILAGSAFGEIADTIRTISTSGMFANADSLRVVVLGKNGSGLSPINSATVLVLRDQKGPRPPTSGGGSLSFDNTYGLTVRKVTVNFYNVNSSPPFPEPMDTSGQRPTVVFKEGGLGMGDPAYLVSEWQWRWTSLQQGYLDISVQAQKNGAYDSVFVDFRKMTDQAGNPVDTTGGAGVVRFRT